MIPFKLQVILLIVSFIVFVSLIQMIRKYKLELKYSLLWLLLSFSLVVLSLVPNISVLISQLIGIETPVNALFLIGIILAMSIVFSLTVALSRISNKMKDLAQDLGILKQEVSDLRSLIQNHKYKENKMQ